MKITLTGSLGHIGKPLTRALVQKGHLITVITSNPEKRKEIEALGATAAIGLLTDRDFITSAFAGADAVHCMVVGANYFDHDFDLLAYYQKLGSNYAQAIRQNNIKKVINISSIGAHLEKGNGILRGAYEVERILNELPADVGITHIRPTEFYYNLLPQVHSAKSSGFLASNIGGDVVNSWVSPLDIANVVAEEITSTFTGRKVRYVASEEIMYNDLTSVLAEALNKPELKWVQLTDEQMQSGMEAIGMQPKIAGGLTEMYAAINSGLLYEHYNLNKPRKMGEIKVADFAKEFADAYKQL